APHCSDGMCRSASTTPPHVRHRCRNPRVVNATMFSPYRLISLALTPLRVAIVVIRLAPAKL
ncbi:hypothetical protein, partial [Escherichia coli]|uniref:hypothetical protein n=1 Tax=Escherichia coli TaxID=562 RepID=UPI0020181F2F